MRNFKIKDEKGREIVIIDSKSRMAFARYPDQKQNVKDYVVKIYTELDGKDIEGLIDFLNYKGIQNEFCS